MQLISAPLRISIGLASLTMSALFAAQAMGLFPNADQAVLDGRKALCESVAVDCSLAAQHEDIPAIKAVLAALLVRNDSVVSVGLRRINGKVVADFGDHPLHWQAQAVDLPPGTQVAIPINEGNRRWGTVEVRFRPLFASGPFAWLSNPFMRLIAFVAASGILAQAWYLRRVLKHLDPSSVIPDRVKATLDTLVEGVLVLDKEQRIVLANKAFAQNSGRKSDDLLGLRADEIRWSEPRSDQPIAERPWELAMHDGVARTGVMLGLRDEKDESHTFVVNTMPIQGDNGAQRGALVTFGDVTSIEQKNLQLEKMLEVLKESRDEIRRQNEELTLLATCDPLTSCLNRRAFFARFEEHWAAAKQPGAALSCVMVDIDHFKSVNDRHGHSMGDQVLQRVAAVLRTTVRESDLVCRYGGEEFCVLLPQTPLAEALAMGERLRVAVAAREGAPLPVTASLGVASYEPATAAPHELLDQADKALYVSKRQGRNRVTSWHALPPELRTDQPPTARQEQREGDVDVPIPFHAVAALTSALSYRDVLTAEHSRRVADLCVTVARGLMSERECYVLEVAALLHDIGKLGVPDAILLKPGPLTEAEWKVMSTHDHIGVEIISAAFSSKELSEIVRTHHAYFGQCRNPSLPCGEEIPLRARILAIADAYDAIVSDRVYRRGRSRAEAFVELRRCAGTQFDPQLVERFIAAVSDSDQSREASSMSVSKQSALRIGLQIERLAGALDARDYTNLSALASRLAATAKQEGVSQIADLAAELEQQTASDPDLVAIVALTTELLELCRATHSSYLASADKLHHEPAAG